MRLRDNMKPLNLFDRNHYFGNAPAMHPKLMHISLLTCTQMHPIRSSSANRTQMCDARCWIYRPGAVSRSCSASAAHAMPSYTRHARHHSSSCFSTKATAMTTTTACPTSHHHTNAPAPQQSQQPMPNNLHSQNGSLKCLETLHLHGMLPLRVHRCSFPDRPCPGTAVLVQKVSAAY